MLIFEDVEQFVNTETDIYYTLHYSNESCLLPPSIFASCRGELCCQNFVQIVKTSSASSEASILGTRVCHLFLFRNNQNYLKVDYVSYLSHCVSECSWLM